MKPIKSNRKRVLDQEYNPLQETINSFDSFRETSCNQLSADRDRLLDTTKVSIFRMQFKCLILKY